MFLCQDDGIKCFYSHILIVLDSYLIYFLQNSGSDIIFSIFATIRGEVPVFFWFSEFSVSLRKIQFFSHSFIKTLLSRTSLESDWKAVQLKLHDAALYHIAKNSINIFNNDSVYLVSRIFVWRAMERIPNFCFTQLFTKKGIVYNISHSNSRTSLSTEDWNPDSSNIW